MRTDYVIFRVGQPPQHGSIDWPADPGLDAIHKLVDPVLDGGDLEHVWVLYGDQRTDMFVDETSAMKGLPRNDEATAIYRASYLSRFPDTAPEKLPAIYGNALGTLRRVWF